MAITRRPFVGGNWKMNTDLASAVELADDIVAACSCFADRCDIAIYPPFPYLQVVGKTLGQHGLLLKDPTDLEVRDLRRNIVGSV